MNLLILLVLHSLWCQPTGGQAINRSAKAQVSNKKNLSDSIPSWVYTLYEKKDSAFSTNTKINITFFRPLSDSTSYCLFEASDNNCLMTFVATQKMKKKYKLLQIGNECDADFSIPEYSFTVYEHDSLLHKITMTENTLKAKPEFLIRENNTWRFKEGYNLESAATRAYMTVSSVMITKDGLLDIHH